MHRQVGDLVMDERGVAQRGLLVRHLVLPGGLAGTAEVARFLAEEISRDTYINVMAQYRPCYRASEHPAARPAHHARRNTPRPWLRAALPGCIASTNYSGACFLIRE